MIETNKIPGVGVLVGRWQVDILHEGHLDLLKTVCRRHEQVLVFLGEAPIKSSRYNPLPAKARKLMLLESFPNVTVLEIKDVHHEEHWSKTLDKKIRESYPEGPVTLYGSRDGFIPYYRGQFKTVELEARYNISGSDIRKAIADGKMLSNAAFRQGWIASCFDRYSTVYPTVDAAIIDFTQNRILLARKPNDTDGCYRFVGGFSDPGNDTSFDESVVREVMEETGLKGIGTPHYICSCKIDDWRYRNELDKIITTFFLIDEFIGDPKPQDDISELKWFKLEEISEATFIHEHKVLYPKLKAYLQKRQ